MIPWYVAYSHDRYNSDADLILDERCYIQYEIESSDAPKEPPSLQIITNALKEFDGSGSGLMTAKQMLAACQTIDNLGFTKQELIEYVKEGQDVAGDGGGKIKMGEFASYLAFESKKKFKKSNSTSSPPVQTTDLFSNGTTNTQKDNSYVNPFDEMFGDVSTQPQPAAVAPPKKTTSNTKITVTSPNTLSAKYIDLNIEHHLYWKFKYPTCPISKALLSIVYNL